MIIKHLQLKLYLKPISSQGNTVWREKAVLGDWGVQTSKFVSPSCFYPLTLLIMGENITGCYSPLMQLLPVRDMQSRASDNQGPNLIFHGDNFYFWWRNAGRCEMRDHPDITPILWSI